MRTTESGVQRLAITGTIDNQAHRIRSSMRDLRKAQSTSENHFVYAGNPKKGLRFIPVNSSCRKHPDNRDKAAVWVVLGTWILIFTAVIAAVLIAVHLRARSEQQKLSHPTFPAEQTKLVFLSVS